MPAKPAALRGALWMGGAVVSFCAMAVAARELLRHMGPFEVLFWRTGIALLILLALVPRIGLATLRTRRFGVHFSRNAIHLAAQWTWVYSLAVLPLATVFAIEFTFPVWVALLAALTLGERLNQGRIVMLVLGLAGVLVILRPGLSVVHPAAFVMLLGALGFAAQMILTKQLSTTESPYSVLFWMSIVQNPITLLLALPAWVAPTLQDLPWMLTIGCGSFAAHYCITRSMQLADASVVVPVDFFRLPVIAVVGALLYNEPLDPAIFFGAALIFVGVYYSISRENRKVA